MFRLTVLLGAGLYLSLLILGADRGQLRFGLRDAPLPAPEMVAAAAGVGGGAAAQGDAAAAPASRPAAAPSRPVLAEAPIPAGVAQMPLVSPASFSSAEPGSAFTFASTGIGLMAQVPDATAAAALAGPDAPGTAETRVVSAAAVNIRSAPSTASEVTGRLLRGEEVLVLGAAQDGWFRVRIEGDGGEGYVAERYLAPQIAD